MSEAKFTKGEWVIVDKSEDKNPFDQKTVNNIVKMPSSQKTKYGACFYASIGGFDIHTQKEEAEANAHLIAAAPEMYEMLEKIHDSMAGNGEYGEFYYDVKGLLAKARGEHD